MAKAGKQNSVVALWALLMGFWAFLMVSKKWWLGPIIVFLVLLSVILVAAGGSALAPFIYTLF